MLRKVKAIRKEIASYPTHSAYDVSIRDYAEALFDWYVNEFAEIGEYDHLANPVLESDLLDGAKNWKEYSWNCHSCALVYDDGDEWKESLIEGVEWLDLQAEALEKAAKIVCSVANKKSS